MDEKKLADAAAGARTLAKQFKAVLAVGEILQEVADLGNLKRERQEEAKKAAVQAAQARADLGRVNAQLEASRDDLERLKEEGRAAADGGREAAEELLAEARKNAKAIVDEAKRHAELIGTGLAEARRRHEVENAELELQRDDLERQIDELKIEMAALRERLSA